jgi:hypothetical protein
MQWPCVLAGLRCLIVSLDQMTPFKIQTEGVGVCVCTRTVPNIYTGRERNPSLYNLSGTVVVSW